MSHDIAVTIFKIVLCHIAAVMDSADEKVIKSFVDRQATEKHEAYCVNIWKEVKELRDTVDLPKTSPSKRVSNAESGDAPKPCPDGQIDLKEAFLTHDNAPADLSVIATLLQHNIRNIIEETRFFERRLQMFESLNKSYVSLMNKLYENKSKELILKVTCDRDNYDPNGCTGAVSLKFQFEEATINSQVSKDIERNRYDFNRIYLELMDLPSEKIVCTAIHTEQFLKLLGRSPSESNIKTQNSLRNYFLSTISDKRSIDYPPTNILFTFIMEMLSFDTAEQRDRNSFFLLDAALRYPLLIEHFAPRLVPSKCSSECFLHMYRHIQERMSQCPPQILFVLLSKFDVGSWLKQASQELMLAFLKVLDEALNSFGPAPNDEQQLVIGLYKKHLQYVDYVK